ncbi:MAG TPA: hypothetical protein VFZ18_05035 [Longimicrobiaceae bacterium]
MAAETRRRGRGAAASLRERLVVGLGWSAAEEPMRVIAVGRQRYRLRAIAVHDGWLIRACDGPGGGGLPAYATRRRIHARAARGSGRAVVVFSDAAGTEQVWAWRVALPVGVEAYREESRSAVDEEPGAERDFGFRRGVAGAGSLDSPEAREGAEAARRALLARLRTNAAVARELPGGNSAAALQELLEASRSPDVPRLLWRELEALRILDPACGSGEWLGGCLEALAAVGESCLERMRVRVGEEQRSGKRSRPEKLSDLKRLVARAAAVAEEGVADRLVRETILLGCLRGADVDRTQAEACQRRLGRTLLAPGGAGGGALELAEVGEGSLAAGIGSAEALADWARRDASAAAVARRVAAEAETLARVERQLMRMRLLHGATVEELVGGLRLLRGRRAVLGVALAPDLPVGAAPVLHPWIEYHGILRSGGFDLVRGSAARGGLAGSVEAP